MGGSAAGPADPSPSHRGRFALVGGITVLALLAGVLALGTLTPSPRPSEGPSAVPASGEPTPGGWIAAELPPFSLPGELVADSRDAAGVDRASSFTLASTGAAAPEDMAARISFVPPVAFRVEATTGPSSVRLIPTAPLEAGRVYRARLTAGDGALEATWAFRVRGPIHVVETIPGDRTTDVPLDAGIELTLDQDGVDPMGDHFSISPAVKGRFERSGRSQVFVPVGLAPDTVYTVTLHRGLGRAGSDVSLERDVTFQFATASRAATTGPAWQAWVDRPVVEASPNERPIIGIRIEDWSEDGAVIPGSLPVAVYRYPSRADATEALRTMLARPAWASVIAEPLDTAGLTRVVRMKQSLRSVRETGGGDVLVRLPARLPRGWYLVDIGEDHEAQALLQVTEVSAWVSVLADRTVTWANDTLTGRPLRGASVAVLDGASIGRTGADGLMVAATPAELVPPSSLEDPDRDADPNPIMVVTARSGRSVLVPFGIPGDTEIYRGEWWKSEPLADESWWSLLATDRTIYRPTDTVNAWGLLRRRAGMSTPGSVALRLVATTTTAPPVAEVTVRPGASGAFATSLAIAEAPEGAYYLEALVDGRIAARRWLEVGAIDKPLYRLSVSADRRAVASGDPVAVTAKATFFDGQPVAGLTLRTCDPRVEDCATQQTDAAGVLAATWRPEADPETEDAQTAGYGVGSVAEEAEIYATADVLVFPSAVTFDAAAALDGRRVVVKGTVRDVDFPRIERELAAGTYEGDPGGAPAADRTVRITVTELIPVRRLVGQQYDWIEKRVVPVYAYSSQRRPLGEWTRRTGRDGAFSLRARVPDASHEYEVILSTEDSAGRAQRASLSAVVPRPEAVRLSTDELEELGPRFEGVSADGYSTGDEVDLRIVDGHRAAPAGGGNRYLYIVAQRGLRDAFVSSSPRFARVFGEADLPRVFVVGIRFTGSTYAPKAATWLDFDIRDRALSVALAADADAYRPGDSVTLTVRTADARGRPVPASVVLRAVDEKLFAIGGALVEYPLESLYSGVTSGILRFTATHQVPVPVPGEGEGGDATGPAVRDEFRDSVLFRLVETGADGTARVTFDLADDLTSWHVSATALTADLEAGEGQLLVPVSLPFFTETVIADGYLAGDRPVLAVRAYGSALAPGDPVEVSVSVPSLGVDDLVRRGTAFTPIAVPLPALETGTHAVTIESRAVSRTDAAGAPLVDTVRRSIVVVDTRLAARRAWQAELIAGTGLPGGDGQTAYTFTDAGRGRFMALLDDLASDEGTRADEAVAQRAARALLIAQYGRTGDELSPPADVSRFPVIVPEDVTCDPDDEECDPDSVSAPGQAGLALLPWSGPSPILAARAALAAPGVFASGDLVTALEHTRASGESSRELRILAIAGLAALDADIGEDLAALRGMGDLSARERLHAALAAEAYGDHAWALALERGLLQEYGRSRGPWARLEIPGALPTQVSIDTALLAMVAAGVGDPVADALFEYVEANPPTTDLVALERVGFVRRRLPHLATAPASFAWTLDGQRHVVDLDPGDSETIELSAVQRAAVTVEPLSGRLSVAAAWLAPTSVAGTSVSGDAAVERRVSPPGDIPPGTIIEVTITPTLRSDASECWEVVDHLPSGLAPAQYGDALPEEDGGSADFTPDAIAGQRVLFAQCTPVGADTRLRYQARVVTAGEYAWEPVVVQRQSDHAIVTLVPETRVTITPP